MHKVLRTSIEVAVLDQRSCFGAVLIEIANTTIQASEENSQSPIHEELDDWPVCNKQNCANQTISNCLEPLHVKISDVSRSSS